jgi:hypothetical protein
MTGRTLAAWLLGSWLLVLATGAAISADRTGQTVPTVVEQVEIYAP